jgi:hypothetical protein
MFKGLQYGQAWIDVWGRVLGAGDSDTFLRNGVGVKGAVYQEWAARWKRDRGRASAAEYLIAHIDEIRAGAVTSAGCPECGTEKGLHTSYCSYADTAGTERKFITQALTDDRPSAVLFCRLGLLSDFKSEVSDVVDEVMASADDEQRSRFAKTLEREKELRSELEGLVRDEPSLVPKYKDNPDRALQVLASMTLHLVMQHAGAFSRLGQETEAPWALLNDRIEGLKSLSASEKERMSPCCAYIRQMSMFSTGIAELVAMQP